MIPRFVLFRFTFKREYTEMSNIYHSKIKLKASKKGEKIIIGKVQFIFN